MNEMVSPSGLNMPTNVWFSTVPSGRENILNPLMTRSSCAVTTHLFSPAGILSIVSFRKYTVPSSALQTPTIAG